jgi:hypothetical protein
MTTKLVGEIRDVVRRESRGFWARKYAESGVPNFAMRPWKDHMVEDPESRPWDTNWGQSGRISSDEQEFKMVEFVNENFIAPDHPIENQDRSCSSSFLSREPHKSTTIFF